MAHFRLFHSWQNEFVHLENTSMRKQRERFVFSFLREIRGNLKLHLFLSFLHPSLRVYVRVYVCVYTPNSRRPDNKDFQLDFLLFCR